MVCSYPSFSSLGLYIVACGLARCGLACYLIIDDRANLEDEIRSRRMFAFWAGREVERLQSKKAELEVILNQTNGYICSLEGDLASLREDTIDLNGELDQGRWEVVRDHFELRVL